MESARMSQLNEEDVDSDEGYEGYGSATTSQPFLSIFKPADRWNKVYFVFMFFGLVCFIPWNFFITAEAFWMFKFRDVNSTHTPDSDHKSELQASFASYVSIAAMVPTTIFLFINTLITSRISLHVRVFGSLFGIVSTFSCIFALAMVNTDEWQMSFFALTMFIVIATNSFSAAFQGALMGLAGSFPTPYMQAVMNGQAMGGIFSALVGIASIGIGIDLVKAASIFFGVAVFLLLGAVATYFVLILKSMFFRYHLQQFTDAEKRAELNVLLLRHGQNSVCYVFQRIWMFGMCAFLVFAETLSVFPAIVVLVVSVNSSNGTPLTNQYFTPVCCFLMYNVGDYTGRVISGFFRFPAWRNPLLPILVALRLGFVPAILLCNAQPRLTLPVYIDSDVAFVLLVLALGISNGYLANLAAIYAPQQVDVEYRQIAGAMMAFFMGSGLAVGAIISSMLIKIL